mmetsp:Transcript_99587/g.290713  ORF Transcript_99587/g.290713 Transcript_99587/m.290713 type:complete len:170 (-) Transcript_99587:172-681(-)
MALDRSRGNTKRSVARIMRVVLATGLAHYGDVRLTSEAQLAQCFHPKVMEIECSQRAAAAMPEARAAQPAHAAGLLRSLLVQCGAELDGAEKAPLKEAQQGFTESSQQLLNPSGCTVESWGERSLDAFRRRLVVRSRPSCEARESELDLGFRHLCGRHHASEADAGAGE